VYLRIIEYAHMLGIITSAEVVFLFLAGLWFTGAFKS